MLDSLTKQQADLMPQVVEEWLAIGLCCEPLDFGAAKLAVAKTYQSAGLAPPSLYFVADSPLHGALMSITVRAQVGDQVGAQVRDQVRDQVRAQVRAQVRDQVGAQVGGAHDAPWLSFYDFFRRAGFREEVRLLDGLTDLARHCGWWSPYRGFAVLQHRHSSVHFGSGRLHCDGGPAVLYRDGFSVWALNGVRVPEWLAVDRAESIDPSKIRQLKNAEVRREFVRKVGLDRIRYKLSGLVLDKKTVPLKTPIASDWPCRYSVESLDFGNGTVRHVLVMDNPSLPEVEHVEYVPVSCRTVEEAMNFRLGRTEAEVDDLNGSPYWLHGDVVIKPKGVRKFRRWPEVAA